MSDPQQWLIDLDRTGVAIVDGLVSVKGYRKDGQPPEKVAIMEK